MAHPKKPKSQHFDMGYCGPSIGDFNLIELEGVSVTLGDGTVLTGDKVRLHRDAGVPKSEIEHFIAQEVGKLTFDRAGSSKYVRGKRTTGLGMTPGAGRKPNPRKK